MTIEELYRAMDKAKSAGMKPAMLDGIPHFVVAPYDVAPANAGGRLVKTAHGLGMAYPVRD